MDNIIRILMVEDDLSDFELAQREICKTLPNCEFQRVETRREYLDALEHFKPDCVLSDYSLPHFNGPEALRLVKDYAPFTPLVIWTGSISEDIAVECMKAGAADYVLKESIKRLGPAMLQALNERKTMLERKQAEEKYRAIFENSPIGIFQSTPEGRFISVNPAMAHIYGYSSPDEMMNSITDISQQMYPMPADRSVFTQLLANQGVVHDFEWKNIRKDGSTFWTSTSARLVRDVSGTILYYEGFLQDITQRKEAEEALRRSQITYQNLVETSHDLIWSVNQEGTITFLNKAAKDIYGYEAQELLGRSFFELIDPDNSSLNSKDFQKSIADTHELHGVESHVRHRDGRRIILSANSIVIRDDAGNVLGITGSSRDITERKQAEAELAKSEKRFRALIENGLDDISLLDANGKLLWESPAVVRNLGYAENEYLERNIFELMHPEDLPWTLDLFQKLVEQPGARQSGMFRLRHANGTWRWVEAIVTNMLTEPSVNAIVVNYRDITERKQAEQELHDSEERFHQLANNIQEVFWITDVETDEQIYISPAAESVWGKPFEYFLHTIDTFINCVLPEDRNSVLAAMEKQRKGLKTEIEYRVQHPDGSMHWIWDRAFPILDENGNVKSCAGIAADITERKLHEMALQRSQARYYDLFDNSPASLWEEDYSLAKQQVDRLLESGVTDLNRYLIDHPKEVMALASSIRVIDVNKAGLDLLQIGSKEDMLKNLPDVIDHKAFERFEEEILGLVSPLRGFRRETVQRRLDGTLLHVIVQGSIPPGFEDWSKVIISITDITERKQAEDELRRQTQARLSLYEATRDLVIERDLSKLLHILVERIARLLNASAGGLYLCEPEQDQLRCVVSYNTPRDFTGVTLKYGEGAAGIVAQTGEPLIIDDYDTWHGQAAIYAQHDYFKAVLSVPIKWQEQVIGVIHALSYEDERRFTEEDLSLILSFANPIAIAIQNARLVNGLEHQNRIHLALQEATLPLIQQLDIADALQTIINQAAQLLNTSHGFIYLVQPDGNAIEIATGMGLFTQYMALRLRAGEGLAGTVWQTQEPLIIQDYHTWNKRSPEFEEHGLRSVIGVPLFSGSNVVGVLGFANIESNRVFNKDDLELLNRFAQLASIALQNARLYTLSQQEVMERKRAEEAEREQRALAEALRDTAETLNSTLDYGGVLDRILAAVGRVVPHTAGTIMLIDGDSAYVVRSHGYNAHGLHNDVLGVRLPLATTDNLRQILETRQTLIINDTHEYAGWKRMELTDWLRSNVGAPILIDGEVVGFILLDDDAVGFFNATHAKHLESFANQAALAIHNARLLQRAQEEIVERKQAELALRESEERFSNAFEFAPIGKALVSLDGRFIKVNHAMSTILGYTAEELLTKTFQEITHPDDLELDVNSAEQVLAGKIVSYQIEKRYLHTSGQVVCGLLSVSLVRDGDNQPQYFIAQVQDITERKHAEEEIRRSAEETAALLRTSLALTNLDLKAILNSIGTSAKALFKADGCRIFLMQPDGESLRCVLALQENAGLLIGLRIKLGEGVTGTVALTGHAEIINHMQDDPRARHVPGTPEAEEEAIMFAPLKERDRTIGVLSIRRAGEDNPFSSNDLELLEAFAAMAASAVSNARLFEETQQRLSEMEALYENGLAVGQLLQPRQIGERIIETFARYLSWHHVTIRLLRPDTDELEVIAYNLPGLRDEQKIDMEGHFNKMVRKVGQGLSGSVVQTGTPLRTGDVHAYPEYVGTQVGIESGLYMPLKVGERVIGVISVESETPNAFTEQDQRLLATLGNQAAIAFENARLYQAANEELLERTRAQSALWASETHYRQLADSITDILFELDYDLRYTHWNKASEMFSGIPAEQAIGKSIQDVWGPSQDSINREEVYRSVINDRQVKTFEAEMVVKGKKHALEITAYPSMHGVSVVARDFTERKLDETILKKRFELMEFSAHHSFEELMRRALDEICGLTESQIGFLHLVEPDEVTIRLQTWSTETLKSFCKLDGLTMHNSIDQAGLWAEALRQRRSIIHNDFESVTGKKGMPTGHAPVHREMLTPIVRNEKIVAIIGVGNKEEHYSPHDLELVERFADYAWDITERKQMETALADERNQLAKRVEERTADLSRANSNLARALRVKDEFLANMSHELRTPLNAILGLSESLSEQVAGPLNEKQQKYLSTINESGHHLLSLINDILDLAKIEAGQITLDINKVDVNSVCQASLRMVKQLAQKKNQEVLFEIDDGIGLMWADERRLKQMIVNLLSNAVKFTPEQGKFGLEVRGNRDENRISIVVWDKGIGISRSDIDRLFKPFVQLDSSLAREVTGTGLGLALVAQMAKLHGGSVSVESEPGEGSRFTIQLPWEPMLSPDSAIRLRSTGKFRAIDPNATNRPTVLVIDDTHEVVLMLRDYLEMNGFKIVTAQDGIEGMAQAKLNHPDLILMDIMMPRMDGFETAQRFRANPEFKQTPIIALTALAMPNDRQRCLAAGMDEYISKPVNLKALVKLIQNILFSKEGRDSK